MWRPEDNLCSYSSGATYLYFCFVLKKSLLLACSSPSTVGWLASKPRGPAYLCLVGTEVAGAQHSGDLPTCLVGARVADAEHYAQLFFPFLFSHRFWGSNSCLHDHKACILLTKTSSKPPKVRGFCCWRFWFVYVVYENFLKIGFVLVFILSYWSTYSLNAATTIVLFYFVVSFILNYSQIPDFLVLITSQDVALAMHVVFQRPRDTCDFF